VGGGRKNLALNARPTTYDTHKSRFSYIDSIDASLIVNPYKYQRCLNLFRPYPPTPIPPASLEPQLRGRSRAPKNSVNSGKGGRRLPELVTSPGQKAGKPGSIRCFCRASQLAPPLSQLPSKIFVNAAHS